MRIQDELQLELLLVWPYIHNKEYLYSVDQNQARQGFLIFIFGVASLAQITFYHHFCYDTYTDHEVSKYRCTKKVHTYATSIVICKKSSSWFFRQIRSDHYFAWAQKEIRR